ncbi:MAG: hypothetical protein JWO43_471, partial [Candidatus Adlerbacteria bacterium]|nr:hypothetical protein [Candidatus Adlerbacteria bacterium]
MKMTSVFLVPDHQVIHDDGKILDCIGPSPLLKGKVLLTEEMLLWPIHGCFGDVQLEDTAAAPYYHCLMALRELSPFISVICMKADVEKEKLFLIDHDGLAITTKG